jgi:MoxR-like ATPase
MPIEKDVVLALLAEVDCMKDNVGGDGRYDEMRIADARDGRFYLHDDRIRTALKVAIITGRPLLVVGPPGCGKSTLARYVAENLDFDYEYYTVNESSEASDVLWSIDHLRRLTDAQRSTGTADLLQNDEHYVIPGALWRAFQPAETKNRGCVLLLDEMDKAGADFANSLLVALGSMEFDVPPLKGRTIRVKDGRIVIVIMTSNGERQLPPALLRRCIKLPVEYPNAEKLIEIAEQRFPRLREPGPTQDRVQSLAKKLVPDGRDAAERQVSTAEFIDLVQVLLNWPKTLDDDEWRMIEGLVLRGEEEYSD